ncbi:FAD-dependent oxidoreductase [Mycolicibacterium rufum]|uniref:FAD-dependent oxidoreductase n=1 Tax=Mycolicibacterium rufum TaxID=318424 RepID=A0A9X2YGN9_9MYCO|nr:FAD-dependent oxidoreductase [Mycolicibacterium rufum]KGI66232.1 FAD-dependent oxidoreductase [Mycolicibacterium rufum]MCV7073597.1 FAD-dependent oxidoreductase [Mycolicibacterium rufum]ULP36983.1 FAD-dependent oxidoreductase [Mycolicibacterium rufum]
MPSLWTDGRQETPSTATEIGTVTSADVVVVGAGITGLTTAVLLSRAGKKVVVVEARHVGAATTGNTTGKVSALQGSKLANIARKHGSDLLRAYVTGNTEGREWLLRHGDEHGLSYQREDDHAYAQNEKGLSTVRSVFSACKEAGLDAQWVDEADVPFPFAGGVRLRDQAQIDPLPYLSSLVAELEKHGGTLLQGVRATTVSGTGPLRVALRRTAEAQDTRDAQHTVTAQKVVLATGMPVLDRGFFFARLEPKRSYCLAFDVPGDITRSMYLSVDSPTRSVRYAPSPTGDKLIVGGAGHTVGRADHPRGAVTELANWAALHYPGAVQTHYWSAQDYHPVDELPYVGPLLPKLENLLVATGFDKWGMTNGVAAALALSSRILGGRMDWAAAFASWSPHELSGIPTALQLNMEVGLHLAKGWVAPLTASDEPEEGQGVVRGAPWKMTATSVVDGVTRTVSPVCPHLGGVVSWNDSDQAWECPLHGSRFAPDGALIEGPATRGLTPSR